MRRSSTVGVIVNPLAGKDLRRLVTSASHTSDVAKVGIVRRLVEAVLDAGATRVLVADDTNGIAARATEGVTGAEVLSVGLSGTRDDSSAAARALHELRVDVVAVLGGDGTCRDVALGWPGLPLIAISTGTNNVFPVALDATAAGWAAGLVASGAVAVDAVATPTKRLAIEISADGRPVVADLALVELALLDGGAVGARAVLDATRLRTVFAALARASAVGLSAVAGRLHPLDDEADGGVVVDLGDGDRRVQVPLTPGASTTVDVRAVRRLDCGTPTTLRGPGVLCLDGERDRVLGPDDTVVAWVERTGPRRIDVERTLAIAARERLFDAAQAAAR
jgi:predicted polyphosphate/ATP-dependent NAD kinase